MFDKRHHQAIAQALNACATEVSFEESSEEIVSRIAADIAGVVRAARALAHLFEQDDPQFDADQFRNTVLHETTLAG